MAAVDLSLVLRRSEHRAPWEGLHTDGDRHPSSPSVPLPAGPPQDGMHASQIVLSTKPSHRADGAPAPVRSCLPFTGKWGAGQADAHHVASPSTVT